jgi:hypothetical protein
MDTSPLLTLWYKPRETLQGLIQKDCGQAAAAVIVALFGGVQAWGMVRADGAAVWTALLSGAVVALGIWCLLAWLLRNFGRWFGADAERRHLRVALGWGLLPWLLAFFLLGLARSGTMDAARLAALYPVFFGLFLYGYVILLLCLQTALRLSFFKTFLCLVVTTLVSFFPLPLLARLLRGQPPAP